ncbi:MAG: phytanoyl-CoA dioxygenase family protein [Cyanobacteria bacterium P01_D01_bin.36]
MTPLETDFERRGFVLLENVLSSDWLCLLQESVEELSLKKAGTRSLLNTEWCTDLAHHLKTNPQINALLPNNAKAIQSTYFKKSSEHNWLVSTHRDQFIPVKQQVNHPSWTAWTEKEGVTFVRPPIDVLKSLVIVRLHLEDNTVNNGPLRVVPASHQIERTDLVNDDLASGLERVSCLVPQGGALVMKPLLLHSSPKLQKGERRVIHLLYGPSELPNGVEWARAI